MLVYEYLDNGSLEQWLHGEMSCTNPLTWDLRMKIAIGTAKGLVSLCTLYFLSCLCMPSELNSRKLNSSRRFLLELAS
jgi:hypothetical protein